MRRVFVLLLVLLLTLSGCKTSSKNGGYQLYFRVDPETATHGAAIAGQNYPGREEPGVEELFAALMAGPTQNGLVSPFPQGVTLLSWELSDGLLTLNLSEQYGGLADVSLALADYCLVLTMSQIAGVDSVQIQSDGHTYHSRSHQTMTSQEAVLDPAWLPQETLDKWPKSRYPYTLSVQCDKAPGNGLEEQKEGVSMSNYQIATECLHAGYRPGNGEPRNFPIVQSTTFRYETSEEMGKLFDLEASGYFYTRLQNPTNDTVAAKIAALEGGSAAMLLSSGQAANFYAIFNIAGCGDHVISSTSIYGGTFNLFAVTMKRMGIEFTFVDPECSEEELNAAFRPNTKAVFGETIANPALTILDIEKFAKAAHAHGVPLIMDNTFATPVNCRPFEWGCDIVTHSTTKYMDGHALTVGGAIVDSGKFDWNAHADKFPGLTTPDESYHGVTYTERFGLEGAFITKATVQLMRDLGSIPSPNNCFLLNIGLETLPLRMKKHCENAQAVAEYLQGHEKIAWVQYAGLPGDKYHERAQKYLPNGTCGVVIFGVKGGRAAAEKFMAGLKLASIATHVADAKTCVLHPASSTHRQMTDEELAAAGVSPDLVRFSVGIEDAKDIIADLEQALANV